MLAGEALINGYSNNELLVICLEYGMAGVNLSVTLRYTLKPNMFNWAVFMTTGYVGVLQCRFEETINGEGTTVDIVALNLSSKKATTIQTDIPREVSTTAFRYTVRTHAEPTCS